MTNNIFRQRRKPNRGMVKSGNDGYAISNDPMPLTLTNELKYVDTTISYGLMSNAGSWTKLTNPSQGVTSTSRLGDRAALIRLELSGYYNVYGGNADVIRMIILQTKGLFTSAPAVTDVLSAVQPVSNYVYNARDLYDIIHDEQFTMCPTGDTAIQQRRFSVKPRIRDMKFVSGSNNVYNGQIYLLFLCSNASNASYAMNIRAWFEDSN